MIISSAPGHPLVPLGLVEKLDCRLFDNVDHLSTPVKLGQQTALQIVKQDHSEVPAIIAVRLKPVPVAICDVLKDHALASWEQLPIPDEVTVSGCEMLYSLEISEKV
jgi:hypothetical protein